MTVPQHNATHHSNDLARCVQAIDFADGLLITAGAGMGVDSGLPDFRGNEGFWQAYPALRQAGISFSTIACPATFREDPQLAWGFYGHRLDLYRRTEPHEGFSILRDLCRHMAQGAFVYTSNVDGQFQKAGVSSAQVVECHGSIHHLQCLDGCMSAIWPADDFQPQVDEARCQLMNEPPKCPWCGGVARPNILMFGDGEWLEKRALEQEAQLDRWLTRVNRLVILEIGAGTAIPSVRHFGEYQEGFLIRINPREPELPPNRRGVSLAMTALSALQAIHAS